MIDDPFPRIFKAQGVPGPACDAYYRHMGIRVLPVERLVKAFDGTGGKAMGRKHPSPSPDSLLTEEQAANRLGCSVKTLRSHAAAGDLRYVQVGRGSKRIRRKFTIADIDAFVASQTRTEVPQSCPSAKTTVRRIGGSTSNIVAIGFSAQPKPQPGAKRKR
jgi:excisionase family DNA binding protein